MIDNKVEGAIVNIAPKFGIRVDGAIGPHAVSKGGVR
jgi:hypothetical protein